MASRPVPSVQGRPRTRSVPHESAATRASKGRGPHPRADDAQPFAGAAGNSPLIFTALWNKKGKPSAVSEPEYFVERVTRSLALLGGESKV